MSALTVLIGLVAVGHYSIWSGLEHRQSALRSAIHGLPIGAKVAVVSLSPSAYVSDHLISEHAATWCVIDRSAFISSLWGRPFQPFLIGIRPEFQRAASLARLDQPGWSPTSIQVLAESFEFLIVFGANDIAETYANGKKLVYAADGVRVVEL